LGGFALDIDPNSQRTKGTAQLGPVEWVDSLYYPPSWGSELREPQQVPGEQDQQINSSSVRR
jgi:hypothetical protein